MKTKKIFYYVLFLTLLISCTSNDIEYRMSNVNTIKPIELKTFIPDTSKIISIERIMDIVNIYNCINQTSRSGGRVVSTIKNIPDSLGCPLMYIINFASNQGFVIFSARKSYYPIVAESEKGNFYINNNDPANPINLWIQDQKNRILNSANLSSDIKTNINSNWMNFNIQKRMLISSRSDIPDKPDVYYDSIKIWTLDPSVDVYLYEDYINTIEYRNLDEQTKQQMNNSMHMYGNSNYGTIESSTIILRKRIDKYFSNQLISTMWSQGAPFNALVPNGYPLGCTTIATGQIMKFHESPSRINWSHIPVIGVSATTQEFLYNLANRIGVDFSEDGSSGNISDIKSCLLNYGYDVIEKKHDQYDVSSEVQKGYPVLMSGLPNSILGVGFGNGHAWICDGSMYGTEQIEIRAMTIEYRPTIYSTPDKMIEAYRTAPVVAASPLKLHFNWGWGGKNDGYFDDSNIEITMSNGEKKNFNHDRKDLYIHPRH